MAVARNFFDWKFAQKVWFEFNTYEKEEAEWAKYVGDFHPWLEVYKVDQRKAFDLLNKMPKDKRINVQHAFDMQLAYDHWFDHVYSSWYNGYEQDAIYAPMTKKKAPTFDDYLAVYAERGSCIPEHMLNECGPVPDWRTPEWRAKEQAMMQTVARQVEENRRKK